MAYVESETRRLRECFENYTLSTHYMLHYEEMASALRNGADPNVQNGVGLTGLSVACLVHDDRLCDLFLRAGADPSIAENVEGDNALHIAIRRVRDNLLIERICKAMIENVGNLNAVNAKGCTALNQKYYYDLLPMALLLRFGADPDIPDKESGKTALHYLCDEAHFHEQANMLVERGADVDIQDDDGNTALHIAVKHNRYTFVLLFIQRLSNPYIRNRDNLLAIDLADPPSQGFIIDKLERYMVLWEERCLRISQLPFGDDINRHIGRMSINNNNKTTIL